MKIQSCLLGTGNMPPTDVTDKFNGSTMTTYPSNGNYVETCLATNMTRMFGSCKSLKTSITTRNFWRVVNLFIA